MFLAYMLVRLCAIATWIKSTYIHRPVPPIEGGLRPSGISCRRPVISLNQQMETMLAIMMGPTASKVYPTAKPNLKTNS